MEEDKEDLKNVRLKRKKKQKIRINRKQE